MFITIEGIDGTGKSTQAARLSEYFRDVCGRDVVLTKEPGGWNGGSVLRSIVTDGTLTHPWSEAYLFMLDRAEHAARVITPSLDAGKAVICERYHDSTLAYQVWGRGLPLKIFDELFALSDFPVPDIKILLDMEPRYAFERVLKRGAPDAFESAGISFMSKVRAGYLELVRREPEVWIKIDCMCSPDEVFKKICAGLKNRGFIDA